MVINPLVSVVIPNYCHSKYLDERIQSVLNQTYRNIEIIILDDCSPDNGASKAVIEKYRGNPYVSQIVYNEVNSGSTFKQWQKGFELAKGVYIWIAESDDFCEPNMLEELIEVCVSNDDVVMAYTTSTLVNENGNIIVKPKSFSTQVLPSQDYIQKYLLLYNFVQNASSAIFKKNVALNISKQYTKFFGAGDFLFWVEICLNGSVAIVNKGLNYFRRHSGVVTSKRESDGTNFREEMMILNYIQSKISIPKWRLKYAYIFRMKTIINTSFINEDIKSEVYDLWDVKEYNSSLCKILLRLAVFLRRFNYFI
jgi:glycosyltransferase involved in cell wall biosynthesis